LSFSFEKLWQDCITLQTLNSSWQSRVSFSGLALTAGSRMGRADLFDLQAGNAFCVIDLGEPSTESY